MDIKNKRGYIDAIRPGVTEREVAAEAEYVMRKNGAEDGYLITEDGPVRLTDTPYVIKK